MGRPVKSIITGWTRPHYNGKCSIDIPTGPTFLEAFIRTNLIAEQLKDVALKLGTDEFYKVKGTDLSFEERYREVYETAPGDGTGTEPVNEFVINFADIANLGMMSRNHTSLVTMTGEKLTLTLEIGDALAGAPEIILELHVKVTDGDPKGRRFMPRRLRGVFDANLLRNNAMPLEKNPNLFYRRVHIESDEITHFHIQKDKERFDYTTRERNISDLRRNERAPQSGWTHIDFIASDFAMADALQADAKTALNIVFDIEAVNPSLEYIVDTVEDLHPEWGAV
jgi:hypothetical protein